VNVVDISAPITSVGFPSQTGLSNADTITVRGTANDLSGVANVEVNGVKATTIDNYENWWVELSLANGDNSISLLVEMR